MLETTLAVPPAPAHDAVAMPALTPQEFLFSALLDGPRPATAIERMAREQHGWSPQGRCRMMRLTRRFIFIRTNGAALSRAIKSGRRPQGRRFIDFGVLASTVPGEYERQWRSLPDSIFKKRKGRV